MYSYHLRTVHSPSMVSFTSFVVCVMAFVTVLVDGHQHTSAQYMMEMLNAVNNERSKAHLNPLCYNIKLVKAAQLHSEDQALSGNFSHTGSNDSMLFDRINTQRFQWTLLGENIAAGHENVMSVMTAWMNSTSHRDNILGNYKFLGMGFAYNPETDYQRFWTVDFGMSSNETCASGYNELIPQSPSLTALM